MSPALALRPFRLPGGLSSRLLLLTAGFVVVATFLILLPSLAAFQEDWLRQRIRAAETASLAVEAVPDEFFSDDFAARLANSAGVNTVAIGVGRTRRLLLQGPGFERAPDYVDLRRPRDLGWIAAPWLTLFGPDDRQLRVVAAPRFRDGAFVEIVAPAEPLKRELWAYLLRILLVSLAVSAAAGGAVFAALSAFIVRPMSRLTDAIERFRADPEDPHSGAEPTGRRDEIGRVEEELARMQDEVRQALRSRARLATLGQAVAKINHDLRNMLTSAQMASERLATSGDPAVAKALPRLERALDRALALASDVLNYGKSEEPPPQIRSVPFRSAVEAAAEDAGLTPDGVKLKIVAPAAARVPADPDQLHRILLNLLRNARQAIESVPERESQGLVTVRYERSPEGDLRILVADDGPGLSEKARERLFQPFSGSARPGGTGLGLAIARELAQAHGGDLHLIDEGPGAVFELRLPPVLTAALDVA
jgi:signal transduction histidine kinase